jgi:hypothetical protein
VPRVPLSPHRKQPLLQIGQTDEPAGSAPENPSGGTRCPWRSCAPGLQWAPARATRPNFLRCCAAKGCRDALVRPVRRRCMQPDCAQPGRPHRGKPTLLAATTRRLTATTRRRSSRMLVARPCQACASRGMTTPELIRCREASRVRTPLQPEDSRGAFGRPRPRRAPNTAGCGMSQPELIRYCEASRLHRPLWAEAAELQRLPNLRLTARAAPAATDRATPLDAA